MFIDYDDMVEHGAPGKQGTFITMARNIKFAVAVVVCCTEEYDKRPNCVRELEYAMSFAGEGGPVPPFKKEVFFVNCGEPGFDPVVSSDLLGFCMGTKLWSHNQTEAAWNSKHGWEALWGSLRQCKPIAALGKHTPRPKG